MSNEGKNANDGGTPNGGNQNIEVPGLEDVLSAQHAGNTPEGTFGQDPKGDPKKDKDDNNPDNGGDGNEPRQRQGGFQRREDPNNQTPDNKGYEGGDQEITAEQEAANVVNLIGNEDLDSLSDEQKEIKEAILNTFKGGGVDNNGNIINKDGEVVLSHEDLIHYLDTEELPTDKDGNQVNALGEVIKSAEDLQKENSVVLSIQNRLQDDLGLNFTDEHGNPLQYEDTDEGLTTMVQDAVRKSEVGAVKKFLENQPQLKDFFNHLALGGSPENYSSSSIDYKNIDVSKLSKGEKLHLIKDSYRKQGLKDPSNLLQLIESAGEERVNSEVSNAILTLDELTKEERVQREEQVKQQAIRQQQETQKYWENVKNIVDKGKLGSINIPKHEKDGFFEYLSKPVDREGRSKDMIAEDNQSEDFNLMVSYLRYKNFDVSKLASLISRETRAQTLRERMKKSGRKVISDGTQNTTDRGKGPGIEDLPNIKQFLYGDR